MFSSEKFDAYLVVFRSDRWRHHNRIVAISLVISNLNLFIPSSCYCDTYFKVSSNFIEVGRWRIWKSKPLMHQWMLLHEINVSDIKLVNTDHSIFEIPFILEFNLDFSLFNIFNFLWSKGKDEITYDIFWLKKQMFVPNACTSRPDVILRTCKFLLIHNCAFYDWVYSGTVRAL